MNTQGRLRGTRLRSAKKEQIPHFVRDDKRKRRADPPRLRSGGARDDKRKRTAGRRAALQDPRGERGPVRLAALAQGRLFDCGGRAASAQDDKIEGMRDAALKRGASTLYAGYSNPENVVVPQRSYGWSGGAAGAAGTAGLPGGGCD